MILRLIDAYLTINYLVRILMENVGIKLPTLGSTIKNVDSTFMQDSGKVYA